MSLTPRELAAVNTLAQAEQVLDDARERAASLGITETAYTSRAEWEIPNLPSRLKELANALIDAGGRAGTDDLKAKLTFDPSRIYHDYKRKRLMDWIKRHISKEARGVYCWLPLTVSKRAQKRTVKLSK